MSPYSMVTPRQVRLDKANVAYLHAGVKPLFEDVCIPPAFSCWLFGLLHDVEQLHFKDESSAWLDARRRTALAIGELGWTDQAALTANLQVLDSFCPALDNPFKGKVAGSPVVPNYRRLSRQ